MIIRAGVANESFKLCTGNEYNRNDKDIYHNHSIKLTSPQNSWAAFQVIFDCTEDFCINVGDDPWFSQLGDVAVIRIETKCDLSVSLSNIGMMKNNDLLEYGEIILHNKVVEVPKNTPRCVWVEINVPEGTAGLHSGEILVYAGRLFQDETLVRKLDFQLDVKGYTMPDASEWNFHLDLWQHLSNIARKAEAANFSDRHFEILERYVESLSRLGQKAVTVVASEIPWSGQRCFWEKRTPANLFEYSIIKTNKNVDGSFRYDYSALNKYIQLCSRYHIDAEIEVFGLVNIWTSDDWGFGNPSDYPDAIRIRYRDVDGTYKYMKECKDIDAYIKALETFFIQEGLIDKVRVAADEPADIELFKKSINHLKRIAPTFKFKAAINNTAFIHKFKREFYDFVPNMNCLCAQNNRLAHYMDEYKDKRFLWYVCCFPDYPNTFLQSNLLESRYIGILTSFMRLHGFLRWNYTVWPEKPREDIRYAPFNAGDLNFVYPAGDMDVLLTLRWKALRRGIEDFELLDRLKKLGKDDIVTKVYDLILKEKDIARFFKADGSHALALGEMCSLDYNEYEQARNLMLDTLGTITRCPY